MSVKLGLIGCGNWGVNLLRNAVRLDNAQLKWACDADMSKLVHIKKCHPDIKCSSVFTEVLEDPEVDGVMIATPPLSHAALARQALLAGKHVFVEKPLSLYTDDASNLVDLSEQKEKILMVGHLLRYHPGIIKLKEIIQEGTLGDIFYVYSQRLNLGVIRRHENALWNLSCHDVSVMVYLLDGLPVSVSAMGNAYVQEEVEDTAFVNLYFPNRQMAHIHVSWLDPHKVRKITVVGSKRMAVFNDMEKKNKIIIYDKGFVTPENDSLDRPIEIREGNWTYPRVHQQEPLHLEIQHFAECIRKNKPPKTGGLEGLRVVEILTAAQKSLENNGQPQKLDYKRPQIFISDKEMIKATK